MRTRSNRDRPNHMGAFPLERLARTPEAPNVTGSMPPEPHLGSNAAITESVREYSNHFAQLLDRPIAAARAPVPDDLVKRAENPKAAAYFLDATMVGCCVIKREDWIVATDAGQRSRRPGASTSGTLTLGATASSPHISTSPRSDRDCSRRVARRSPRSCRWIDLRA